MQARPKSAPPKRTPKTHPQKKKEPRPVSWTRLKKSAMTYFPAEQYHRQRKFHFCVRDGNRCFLSLVVTDKTVEALSGRRG